MELLNNIELAQRLWKTDEQGLLLQDWERLCQWLKLELCALAPSLRGWSTPFVDRGKFGDEDFVSVSIEAGASWTYKGKAAVSLYFAVFANSVWDENYHPSVGLGVVDHWPYYDTFYAFIAQHKPDGFVTTFADGSPDPNCAFWKDVPLQEFQTKGVFDLDGFVRAIGRAFESLAAVRPAVDEFMAQPPDVRSVVAGLGKAVILDLEGFDEVVEVGMILVAYDSESGELAGVLDSYEGLRYPGAGAKLPSKFTPKMLAGKKLEKDKIEDFIGQASVIISHNNAFDRPRFEKLFPSSRSLRWLCSLNGLSWSSFGFEEANLESLCGRHAIKNRDPHRAFSDAEALLHVLAQKRGSVSYFSELLHSKGIPKPKVQVVPGKRA